MLSSICFILFIISLEFTVFLKGTNDIAKTSLDREKRYLLYPDTAANVIQLIIGIGIPVEVKPESIIFGWAFRAFYTMPSNISELQPMDYGDTSRSRDKRSLTRWQLYKMLEFESQVRGFGGRPCVLRSICEAADVPFNKDHGLLEELFHTIFTPTSTNELLEHHTDNEYYSAQWLGKKNKGKCRYFYPDCKLSFMEMFTYYPGEEEDDDEEDEEDEYETSLSSYN